MLIAFPFFLHISRTSYDRHMFKCATGNLLLTWTFLIAFRRTVAPDQPSHGWKNFFLTAGFGEVAAVHYTAIFKAQEMEIDMLPELTHELLMQMGFPKAGPRIKILRLRDAILRPQTGERTYMEVSGPDRSSLSAMDATMTFPNLLLSFSAFDLGI